MRLYLPMLTARIVCILVFLAVPALCLVAVRHGFSFVRSLATASVLLVAGRLTVFWVLLFTERTGRDGVSPILQEILMFPEWMIYGGITGLMARALIGTSLVLVGSLAWAALLGLGVMACRRAGSRGPLPA
ncbi:MAG: hypothetical protein HYY93_15185 [Planctomycetes bacterium]|nr:hypothetical protein [Planctomycetota bacterium]